MPATAIRVEVAKRDPNSGQFGYWSKKLKSLLISTFVFAATMLRCLAEPPPDALVEKLTAIIRKHCPDAKFEVTNGLFTAKYGTMWFELYVRQMTGEILPKTRQEEGPNFKGFVLKIGVEKGPYAGQPVIPQELQGPYYPTFIDGPPTEEGSNHYWIRFSYGSRFDPKLKQAIFDALPKRNSSTPSGASSHP